MEELSIRKADATDSTYRPGASIKRVSSQILPIDH